MVDSWSQEFRTSTPPNPFRNEASFLTSVLYEYRQWTKTTSRANGFNEAIKVAISEAELNRPMLLLAGRFMPGRPSTLLSLLYLTYSGDAV